MTSAPSWTRRRTERRTASGPSASSPQKPEVSAGAGDGATGDEQARRRKESLPLTGTQIERHPPPSAEVPSRRHTALQVEPRVADPVEQVQPIGFGHDRLVGPTIGGQREVGVSINQTGEHRSVGVGDRLASRRRLRLVQEVPVLLRRGSDRTGPGNAFACDDDQAIVYRRRSTPVEQPRSADEACWRTCEGHECLPFSCGIRPDSSAFCKPLTC